MTSSFMSSRTSRVSFAALSVGLKSISHSLPFCSVLFVSVESGEPARVARRLLAVVLGQDRQLLRLDRTLRVNRQHRLVAAEFTGCQVADHPQDPQPLLPVDPAGGLQVTPQRRSVLLVVE